MKHKSFALEVKELNDTGTFSGYLSVFGNVDSYREIVVPGAFKDSLEKWGEKGTLPPVLWQHDSREPIGRYTKMVEDEKGLFVEGKLLINTIQRAKEAYELLKEKVITGMSIGFETVGEEISEDKRTRLLTKLNLWEGSIVTFPANQLATVDAVKSLLKAGELPTLREFENFLREAGFSKTESVAITNHGLSKLLRSESDGDVDKSEQELLTKLKSLRGT